MKGLGAVVIFMLLLAPQTHPQHTTRTVARLMLSASENMICSFGVILFLGQLTASPICTTKFGEEEST